MIPHAKFIDAILHDPVLRCVCINDSSIRQCDVLHAGHVILCVDADLHISIRPVIGGKRIIRSRRSLFKHKNSGDHIRYITGLILRFCKNAAMADPKSFTADAAPL